METVYDWVSIGIFAGLIVLFLQRSTSAKELDRHDSLPTYLGAGVGCAIANYLGNKGNDLLAIILIIATLAFVFYFLRPFAREGRS
jgi:hypothetical protein